MKHELNEIFNKEVDRYKNTLLFYARQCEWDTFKDKAGTFFDYVESIEMSEIERRFFNISKLIVLVLAVFVVFVLKLNMIDVTEIAGYKTAGLKKIIILAALAVGCFEVYFYSNFKRYMKYKTIFYKKRKERFIVDIERDFQNITVQQERFIVERERDFENVTVQS